MKIEDDQTQQQSRHEWLKKWWPIIIVALFLLWGIVAFYIPADMRQFQLITFLVQGLVALAVIIYVIYTRDLAIYSQQTAMANERLVESMRSLVVEQWEVKEMEDVQLIPGGDDLSRDIYVDDKDFSQAKYDSYVERRKIRVLIFKPMNCGTRTVFLKSIWFAVACSKVLSYRQLPYDAQPPAALHKDEFIEIPVIYDIEGAIEARVVGITYQDGDLEQTKWIANPFEERRFFEPERKTEEESHDLPS